MNQIIPRYLATSGALVLHASAVALQTGQSIAFLGNSGFGKSTLASSFHRNGAQLIIRHDAGGVDLSPCVLDSVFLLNDPVNTPEDRKAVVECVGADFDPGAWLH